MNRRLRLALLRWHRRVGVVIALLVLMLVVTGIALNHSSELALDRKPVRNGALLALYGIDVPAVTAFDVGSHWLSHLGGSRLYLDAREIAYCESPFSGAVRRGDVIAALCAGQLLLLDRNGEIIERIGEAYGLPAGIDGIARRGRDMLLRGEKGVFRIEPDTLVTERLSTPAGEVDWAQPKRVPESLRQSLISSHTGSAIDWERALLDLHSGRLFGRWGVWVIDAVAVALGLLALSGAWVWLTKPGRFKNVRRRKSDV